MDFATWEPAYERILADFGFGPGADERARDALAALVDRFDTDRIDFRRERVAVAGAGPNLEAEADRARRADTVVAASTAGPRLDDVGVAVDYVVTDLDGDPTATRALAAAGATVVAHAHGDNLPAVEEHVPAYDGESLLATTQAAPAGPVYNFGGFTDGDRAAFLADHFGAAELVFPGWAFDDPQVDPLKAQKLVWAERLLYWLEQRRDERFGPLEGRRADLALPTRPE